MNRALRRDITRRKYISRIKNIWRNITIKENGRWRHLTSWTEAKEKCKWIKLLKHGKVYGRSTMNVLEKHFKVKKLREESKKLTHI